MFSPFIAFIVLFCQCLESGEIDDLHWLENFRTSIALWRNVSDAVDKLAKLSQALYDVAFQVIELKKTQNQNVEHDERCSPRGSFQQRLRGELDSCLCQLGLWDPAGGVPPLGRGGLNTMGASHAIPDVDIDAIQIGNWFNGITDIMGWSEDV